MAQKGNIYESTVSGDLFELETTPPFDAHDNTTLDLVRLKDGEWYGIYYDDFTKNYLKVADSRDELEG